MAMTIANSDNNDEIEVNDNVSSGGNILPINDTPSAAPSGTATIVVPYPPIRKGASASGAIHTKGSSVGKKSVSPRIPMKSPRRRMLLRTTPSPHALY